MASLSLGLPSIRMLAMSFRGLVVAAKSDGLDRERESAVACGSSNTEPIVLKKIQEAING